MISRSHWRVRAAVSALFAGLFCLATVPAALAQQPAAPEDHSQHMQHQQAAPAPAAPPAAMDHAGHDHSGHGGMTMPDMKKPDPKKTKKTPPKTSPHAGMTHGAAPKTAAKPSPGRAMSAHEMQGMPGMSGGEHAGHDMGGMHGFLGTYAMMREGSGTSWVPDTSPHEGIFAKYGEWNTMWHALINGVYDTQGGPRGASKTFASGMLMGMAQRDLGDGATLGFRAMLSPEPFMGPSGYPVLFATGETADGRSHLVDRQHPHDLFMELATTYSRQLTANTSVFLYAGLPGEPALGPAAFMHRTSGADNPEAPITHHWLDSTHITFGVVTAGVVVDKWKLEASTFRGREPDQYRYDIEAPKLDSVATRLSWNPAKEVSMQVSWGRLHSPEALDPTVNEDRFTTSAIYTKAFDGNLWSTTLAWGRKMLSNGDTTNGYLVESALLMKNNVTLFGRAEWVRESELFEEDAAVTAFGIAHPKFDVAKVSVGGIYDFVRTEHAKFGIGALVSRYSLPGELAPFYGDPTSGMIFARLKVM